MTSTNMLGDVDGFEGVYGEHGLGKRNVEGRRLLEFCNGKELCVANTWFERGAEENNIQVWVEIKRRLILSWLVAEEVTNVKAIRWELQHWLVVT